MNPDLVKLLDLQAKDLELLEADTRLLEVMNQVAAFDAELEKARDVARVAERAAADARRRRDELEGKIEAHRKHQDKRKEKLGFVHTPKDIQNLMAEIDLAASILSQEEEEWVRSAEAVKGLEVRVAEAEQATELVETSQVEARTALGETQEALQAERDALQARRAASAAEVHKPLLTRYDRLRTSRNASVVVALSGAACGACYTTIPLNRRTQMRGGMAIEFCESCGVILYLAE